MKFPAKSLALGLALVAGAAFAQSAERETLMKSYGGALKTLADMGSGKVPFDATAAEAAKATLATATAEIPAKFEANDPSGKASPAIWTSWDDFVAKSKALGDAAAGMDVSTAEGVGAAMGAIGPTCQACHSAYRM